MGLSANTTGLNEILTAVNNLPPAGGGQKPEETFDVTPTTSIQTITPSTGHVFSSGTVQAIQTETKSTTVNGDVTPTSGKFLTKVTVNVPTGTARSSADLTVSGATVTAPAGLYATAASKSVASGAVSAGLSSNTGGSATAVISNVNSMNTIASPSGTAGTDYFQVKATATGTAGSVTPKAVVGTAGYLAAGTTSGTATSVSVSSDSTGKSIYIPKASLSASGSVTVSGSGSVNPGTNTISKNSATNVSVGTVTTSKPSSGYYVAVDASTAAGSGSVSVSGTGTASAGVSSAGYAKTSLTGSGSVSGSGSASVTVPAKAASTTYIPITTGAYSASATKGTVSGNSITVTPKATIGTAGYLAAGSKNGSAVTVSASELVSGTANIVTNGSVDVTNLATASVNVPASSQTVKFYDYRTWDLTNCQQYGTTCVDENWTNNIGTTGVSVGDLILLDITGKDSSGSDANYQNIIKVTSMSGITAHGDVIAQVKKGETLALTYSKTEQTKSQSITANGSYTISPDSGKVLSSATANVNVPASAVTSGTKSITTTASTDVTTYKNAQVSDANLVAGNIANGVSILGILGTFNPTKVACGTVALSGAGTNVVTHNLGVVPDIVAYINTTETGSSSTPVWIWGVSKKTTGTAPTTLSGQTCVRYYSSGGGFAKYTSANVLTSTSGNGAPYNATATQFTFGYTNNGFLTGTYMWIAAVL